MKKDKWSSRWRRVMLAVALVLVVVSIINTLVIVTLTGKATESSGQVGLCIMGPPNITEIPNQNAVANQNFYYAVNCSQHCGEPLSFAHLNIPTLNSFNINSSTGIINFTPQIGEEGNYHTYIYCSKATFDPDSEYFLLSIASAWLGPTYFDGRVNADKQSIDLNWSAVSSADYYNIYYSSNLSAMMLLDVSGAHPLVTELSNITALNWTDTNASQVQKRYYLVSAVKNTSETLTASLPVGKFSYYYDAPVSTVYGTLATNQIYLYLNVSYTAESFLQEIPAQYNPTISQMDKSNSSGEYYTTHVRGLNDGNNYNLESNAGYQLTVDGYYNHTIAGKVYNRTYTLSYTAPVSSTYGTLASNFRGPYDFKTAYTAESFLQEIPSGYNPTISRLEKSNSSGEYYTTHVRGLNDGNNFAFELGKAYLITVDAAYNHTLCTTSSCFQ